MNAEEHPHPAKSDRGTKDKTVRFPEAKGDFYEPYIWYARTVRFWFIAYGIGVPAAVMGNERLYEKLVAAHELRRVIGFFLTAIVLQVISAVLYRTAMWYLYDAEGRSKDCQKRARVRVSNWFSNQYWPEVFFDVASLACLAVGTWFGLAVLCK